jgi:D-serine deaminase-like pyridoxal phosphate-dependent protein
MVTLDRVATSVLTHVISLYPHRHEAMCDAAAIAMARDAGPIPGFGRVVYPTNAVGWGLGRMSQEHGTLVQTEGETGRCARDLELGEMLRIVGQHAW